MAESSHDIDTAALNATVVTNCQAWDLGGCSVVAGARARTVSFTNRALARLPKKIGSRKELDDIAEAAHIEQPHEQFGPELAGHAKPVSAFFVGVVADA